MRVAAQDCPELKGTTEFNSRCAPRYNTDECTVFSFCLNCDNVPLSIFSFMDMKDCMSGEGSFLGMTMQVNLRTISEADLAQINEGVTTSKQLPARSVSTRAAGSFLTSLYSVNSAVEGTCIICDSALEASFKISFCTQLALPSCVPITVECVKGPGQPQQMERAIVPSPPCTTVQIATRVQMGPGQENAGFDKGLFNVPLSLPGYLLQTPDQDQVLTTSRLQLDVSNILSRSAASEGEELAVTDAELRNVVASSLNVSPSAVYPSDRPLVVVTTDNNLVDDTQEEDCPHPHLGDLCGWEAGGVIFGIVLAYVKAPQGGTPTTKPWMTPMMPMGSQSELQEKLRKRAEAMAQQE
eukprot:gene31561-6748_t